MMITLTFDSFLETTLVREAIQASKIACDPTWPPMVWANDIRDIPLEIPSDAQVVRDIITAYRDDLRANDGTEEPEALDAVLARLETLMTP